MKLIIVLSLLFTLSVLIECSPANKAYVVTIEVNDDIEIEEFSFKGKPKSTQLGGQYIPAIFGQPPVVQPAPVAPQPPPPPAAAAATPKADATTVPPKKAEADEVEEEEAAAVEEEAKR
jgi:hypothetical protein